MNIERWGWYSIAVNVMLGVLHGMIAFTSGSLAVVAELTHNIVDLAAAVAVLIGLKLAGRKSKFFPYGLYKIENVVAASLAIMVFLAAYEIARDALLARTTPVRVENWMLAALIATAALPLVFSHFELRAGKAANSPALIADAREYQVHAFTTGLALAALISVWFQYPLDRIAALVIVLAVIKTGWSLLRDAMRVLLDASLDAETLDHIRKVINAEPAVVEVKWLTGRNAGRFRFIEAGVTVRVAELDRAETVIRRIETKVRTAVPHVERVLVHIEAPATPCVRYAVPLNALDGTVSQHFGEAPFFALAAVRRSDGVIEEQRIVSNPHSQEEKAKGIRVAEWLVAQKIDVVLTREDLSRKGPAYVLREAGVELRMTGSQTVADAILPAILSA
jgi:cation diffusion facilitator family transporter